MHRSENGVEECVHASRSGRLSQATKQNFGSHIESERSMLAGFDWQLIDLRCTALGCECSSFTTKKS